MSSGAYLLAALLAAGALRAAPADFPGGADAPSYRESWGAYQVSVDPAAGEQRFRITDARGKVLREIRAPFIDRVDYPDLSGRGRGEELRVVTAPESNTLAEIHTYCFTRRGGLRPLLGMPYVFEELRDLDGDGRPEIISDDAAPLEWAAGLCHGCCPSVMVVLRWNGDRYALANRRFPKVAERKAREERARFLQAIPQEREEQLSAALGYWANLATAGEEKAARRWLLPRLSPGVRTQLLEALPEVRARLAALPAQITTR